MFSILSSLKQLKNLKLVSTIEKENVSGEILADLNMKKEKPSNPLDVEMEIVADT